MCIRDSTREHQQFIDELLEYVHAEGIDTLLISGDVYDSTIPTAESTTLLDQALTRLMRAGVQVILSSGNHDSFRRLSYGAAFFEASGVHLRTSLEDATRPVEFTDGTLRVHVYAIPYLAPRLHATALGVEPTHRAVLSAVTDAIRADIADRRARGEGADRVIVMSHATVSNTAGNADTTPRSDSERDISVGGIDWVPASLFDSFDYVALGHIHKRYPVTATIRYSGSPLGFSFSEETNRNGAYLIELTPGEEPVITGHEWATRVPVSYTHLDVYKRQGRCCESTGKETSLLLCVCLLETIPPEAGEPCETVPVEAGCAAQKYADYPFLLYRMGRGSGAYARKPSAGVPSISAHAGQTVHPPRENAEIEANTIFLA